MHLRLSVATLSFACMLAASAQIIEKGKSVQISVTGITEKEKGVIDGIYPISEDGILNLRLIGKISAAGLATQELEKTLDKVSLERGIYANARFQVMKFAPCAMAPEFVIVRGRVKKPGSLRYARGLTILNAVQGAGGADFAGPLQRVRVTREGKSKVFDFTDDRQKEFALQRNDLVEVLGE